MGWHSWSNFVWLNVRTNYSWSLSWLLIRTVIAANTLFYKQQHDKWRSLQNCWNISQIFRCCFSSSLSMKTKFEYSFQCGYMDKDIWIWIYGYVYLFSFKPDGDLKHSTQLQMIIICLDMDETSFILLYFKTQCLYGRRPQNIKSSISEITDWIIIKIWKQIWD